MRGEGSINYLISFLYSPKPATRGHNPVDEERRRGGITLPVTTDRDYELRSQGPASLGTNAHDNLVSRSRRSSPITSSQSTTGAAPSSHRRAV
jgi:hypothetical protein